MITFAKIIDIEWNIFFMARSIMKLICVDEERIRLYYVQKISGDKPPQEFVKF
jgi:hypothetical protein